jgi:hypothetical protein
MKPAYILGVQKKYVVYMLTDGEDFCIGLDRNQCSAYIAIS